MRDSELAAGVPVSVNQRAVGSSPTSGATSLIETLVKARVSMLIESRRIRRRQSGTVVAQESCGLLNLSRSNGPTRPFKRYAADGPGWGNAQRRS